MSRQTVLTGSKINGKTKIQYYDQLCAGHPQVSDETHCFDLASEVMHRCTENFARVDAHYGVDSFNVIYKCLLDGRKYKVTIKTEE